MSLALVELGFERPKDKYKFSLKDTLIAVAWASLVVMIGMSIASSIKASTSQVAYDSVSVSSQGL